MGRMVHGMGGWLKWLELVLELRTLGFQSDGLCCAHRREVSHKWAWMATGPLAVFFPVKGTQGSAAVAEPVAAWTQDDQPPIIPVVLPAHAAKARESRALQTLRDIGRTSLLREASGVRRIPPLLTLRRRK